MKAYQMLTLSGRLLVICCLLMACTARREIYMFVMSNGTQVPGSDLSVTSEGRISVRDTRYQGYGVVSFTNGDHYYGEFRDGKRHGLGVYMDLHREACQAGRWADGEFAGMPAIAIAPPDVTPPSLPIYHDVSTEEITQAKQLATQFFDDAVEIEKILSYWMNFGQYRFIKVIGIQRHSGTNRVTEHVLTLEPSFKLTEQAFNALRDDNVPEDVLKISQPLKNKNFFSRKNFLGAIRKHIRKEYTTWRHMEELFLKHARSSILAVYDYRQRDLRELTVEGHLFRLELRGVSDEDARSILAAFLKRAMILDASQEKTLEDYHLSAYMLDTLAYDAQERVFSTYTLGGGSGALVLSIEFQLLPCSEILRILEVGIIALD